MLTVATDITVYCRPGDEESTVKVLDEVHKLCPDIKVSVRTSSMVPEGSCIFVRNDFKPFDLNQPFVPFTRSQR